LSPHSFARLKAIPELRQIISHTCLDAIHAAAGSNQHLIIGKQAISEQRREMGEKLQREQQQSSSTAFVELSKNDLEEALSGSESAVAFYRMMQGHRDASLLAHLAPGLRLCLAAEVAVGMLCPG
jgi:hypothetical protein